MTYLFHEIFLIDWIKVTGLVFVFHLPCFSRSERAAAGPTFHGTVQTFCRNKGHGFIKPKDGGEALFCHISEYVTYLIIFEPAMNATVN